MASCSNCPDVILDVPGGLVDPDPRRGSIPRGLDRSPETRHPAPHPTRHRRPAPHPTVRRRVGPTRPRHPNPRRHTRGSARTCDASPQDSVPPAGERSADQPAWAESGPTSRDRVRRRRRDGALHGADRRRADRRRGGSAPGRHRVRVRRRRARKARATRRRRLRAASTPVSCPASTSTIPGCDRWRGGRTRMHDAWRRLERR